MIATNSNLYSERCILPSEGYDNLRTKSRRKRQIVYRNHAEVSETSSICGCNLENGAGRLFV